MSTNNASRFSAAHVSSEKSAQHNFRNEAETDS